jgi:hypothetical protein
MEIFQTKTFLPPSYGTSIIADLFLGGDDLKLLLQMEN